MFGAFGIRTKEPDPHTLSMTQRLAAALKALAGHVQVLAAFNKDGAVLVAFCETHVTCDSGSGLLRMIRSQV